jgi:hypothetical protein
LSGAKRACLGPVAVALGLLCGCDPIWSLSMSVRDPSDRPIRDATLIMVCDASTAKSAAARSAADGEARLGGLGASLPAGCAVAIAHPGYATRQTSFEEICRGQPLGECDRVREEKIVLEPLPAAPRTGD